MPMGRKQKKWMSLYMALVLTVTVGATTAFAAGDPLSVINNLSTFIFSLIRAIGLILLGFGVVRTRDLLTASFRFHLTMDTLAVQLYTSHYLGVFETFTR